MPLGSSGAARASRATALSKSPASSRRMPSSRAICHSPGAACAVMVPPGLPLGAPKVAPQYRARMRFSWRVRRGFWNGLAVLKFHGQKPAVIPPGTADTRPVALVPFTRRYPDIPIGDVVVADRIPTDESDRAKRVFTRIQHRLVQRFSPMQAGLPMIPSDADAALDEAYSPAHRRCFPAPQRPREHDLGAIAVASPYASYLEATGPGSFRWDLTSLAGFECHPGLVEPGAVVDFAREGEAGQLAPVRIESALGIEKPGTSGWDDAARLAMCSLTSHASMVRHFNWLHLTGGPACRGRHPQPPAGRSSRPSAAVAPRVRHPRRQRPRHRDHHVQGRRVRADLQPHPPRDVPAVRGHDRGLRPGRHQPRGRRRPARAHREPVWARRRTTTGAASTACSSDHARRYLALYYASR